MVTIAAFPRTLNERLQESQSLAREYSNQPAELNLTGLKSRAGTEREALVKLKMQKNQELRRQLLSEYRLALLEELPLPGQSATGQSLLLVQGEDASLDALRRDVRVSYAVPNTRYEVQAGAHLRCSTSAATVIRSITQAEQVGARIRSSNWGRDNLAVEDALRRAAPCVAIDPPSPVVKMHSKENGACLQALILQKLDAGQARNSGSLRR